MGEGVILYKTADFVGRGGLEPALADIEHLVEKLAHVVAQAAFFGRGEGLRIFAGKDPSALREGKLEFVAVMDGPLGAEGHRDFRDLKVADADELVIDLPAFRLELGGIRQGLPAAAAADAEMAAERLQAVLGRLFQAHDAAFHIILFLLADLDVDKVAGNSKLREDDGSVRRVAQGFAFGGDGFDPDVFQQQVGFLARHGCF